jgi:hypothetical protein
LYNHVNTTIILESRTGYFKFYGAVVEASTYWKDKLNFAYPSATSNTLKSTNPFYYSYQLSILT